MPQNYLLHTPGDVVLVMAARGNVRAYRVQDDGSVREVDAGRATALQDVARKDTGCESSDDPLTP